MTYDTVEGEAFFVAGIAVRTTNDRNEAQKAIGELWQKFYAENVGAKIADKASDDVYCVYTNYESDHNGFYTAIIGHRLTVKNSPSGFDVATIPAGKYLSFTSIGKIPEAVLDTWKFIWQADFDRKYSSDFDVYKTEPSGIVVTTFVAIN
jgi:predicted transcriptional regulator YdeE